MVHHHRSIQLKKDEESQNLVLDFGNTAYYKRTRPKLLPLIFLFSLVCCSLLFSPRLFSRYSFGVENHGWVFHTEAVAPICSSMSYGSICCDRNSIRSDICFMRGDIRTHSASSSILLYSSSSSSSSDNSSSSTTTTNQNPSEEEEFQHEKIKPYTRKWESSIMDTIDELHLVVKSKKAASSSSGNSSHICEVRHSVPAVVFSNGGYTGNVYHEFNDGILPLYITSQHFKKQVVFVVLEYHQWWITKYGDIISRLSDYPPIDFNQDKRTHCFPELIVGLRIHDELTVDSSLMHGNKTIRDFRKLLDKAYWPRISGLIRDEEALEKLVSPPSPSSSPSFQEEEEEMREEKLKKKKKPKLVILSRNGSRAITNENAIVELAEEIGFQVQVLRPDRTTELAKTYRALNSSDAMIGVHGAAMTHFLFMRPGTVFIQIIPLGTDWAAQTYYGDPSLKLGLKYIGYKILPRESSLYAQYDKDDPVLRDPDSVNTKGWEFTKKVYLDGQNVKLDLGRFRKRLVRAYNYYYYYVSKRNQSNPHHPLRY